MFQNVRITADTANNSIVVYANQEDHRIIERAVNDFDRPRLQVARRQPTRRLNDEPAVKAPTFARPQ